MCRRCSGHNRLWSFFVQTPGRFVVSAGAIALILWYMYLTTCPAQSEHALWIEQGAPAWVDALGVLVGVVLSAIVTLLLFRWFRPILFLDIPFVEKKAENKRPLEASSGSSDSPVGKSEEQDIESANGEAIARTDLILKIPVENCDLFFAAVNLRIEAAGVDSGFTYHLDLDRQEFIMLPARWRTSDSGGWRRVYHAHKVNEYTQGIVLGLSIEELLSGVLGESRAYLRVRIHATHEFTGFGRAFEARFKYHPDRKEFTRIGCGCK